MIYSFLYVLSLWGLYWWTKKKKTNTEVMSGEIFHRLAHDMKSPLAAMEIGLDILAKKMPSEDLSLISHGIQNIREITQNAIAQYNAIKMT